MKYIISYNEQSKELCYNELASLNLSFQIIRELNNSQSIVSLCASNLEFLNLIKYKPLIFVRHIIMIENQFSKDANSQTLTDYIKDKLNKKQTYSLQYQTNISFKDKTFNLEEVSNNLNTLGYTLNVKQPDQIVSIYETENSYYISVANKELNLSSYKGGMPHFSKKQEFISRAEYKLQEVINILNLDLTTMKLGADLGSAPGGWTKVLANSGMQVHSIDPANLNKTILANKNVKAFKMTTEKYLDKYNYSNFDIIVNDMKMDINLSSQIILDFYSRLKSDGIVIMTFKLAKDFNYKNIITTINKLKEKYELILARQLFHNRSEITVALKKN